MLVREREVCQHIVLGEVHQLRESWPARAEPVGNASPGRLSTLCIRLVEDGADGRGNHLLRALWHQRQGVTHEMHHPNAIDRIRFSSVIAFDTTAQPYITRRRSDAKFP